MASTRESRLGRAPGSGAKEPCVVATTANITLSGLQTVNGVILAAGDRVLVKDQTDATENGVYDVATGAWTRATDFNANDDIVASIIFPVTNSVSAVGLIYQLQFNGDADIGTTEFSFTQVGFDPLTAEDWGLITEAVDSTDDYGALA